MTWLAIVLGASAGASCRYLLQREVDTAIASTFPWGTLAVNLSGCFVFGLIAELAGERVMLGREWRMLLLVGFLGSYTTFSTFAYDGLVMLENGDVARLGLQVAASVAGGVAAAWLGVTIARLA